MRWLDGITDSMDMGLGAFTHRVAFEEGSGPRVLLKIALAILGFFVQMPNFVISLPFRIVVIQLLSCVQLFATL